MTALSFGSLLFAEVVESPFELSMTFKQINRQLEWTNNSIFSSVYLSFCQVRVSNRHVRIPRNDFRRNSVAQSTDLGFVVERKPLAVRIFLLSAPAKALFSMGRPLNQRADTSSVERPFLGIRSSERSVNFRMCGREEPNESQKYKIEKTNFFSGNCVFITLSGEGEEWLIYLHLIELSKK